MAVDFGLLNTELPGQIATSFSRGYEGAQKLAQEKETNALNLKIKNEELAAFQQDRQKLLEFRDQMAKVGKGGNLRQISDVFLGSGIPDQIKLGTELKQEVEKHDRLAKALGEPTSDELFATVPSTPAMPGALGSGAFGVAPEPVAAPAQAPVRRALTTDERINNLIREGFTQEANALISQQKALARENQLLSPAEEAQKIRIALASRPPAAPRPEPAPSIAQIEDPNNPGRMITVDARRYVPGTNVGVIGSAGKTTAAVAAEQKSEAGKSQLQSELDNLRVAYQNLETMRAIPSTERGVVSNVLAGTAATGIGQAAGRLFGTEEQVERDVINSSKLRLMNAIKQATGMSAQQLNSNIELQTMLKSLSDPSQAVQTVERIISSIENAYVKGQGMQKPSKTPVASGNLSPAEQAELDQLRKRFGK